MENLFRFALPYLIINGHLLTPISIYNAWY